MDNLVVTKRLASESQLRARAGSVLIFLLCHDDGDGVTFVISFLTHTLEPVQP